MYLTHLSVNNIKRIVNLKLGLTQKDGSPRMWTVLVGEHGTCKTTLLQCVALAAYGREDISILEGNLTFQFPSGEEGNVKASFQTGCGGIKTTLKIRPDQKVASASHSYDKGYTGPRLRDLRGLTEEPQGFFVVSYNQNRKMPHPLMVMGHVRQHHRFQPLFIDIPLYATLFGDKGRFDWYKANRKAMHQVIDGLLPGLGDFDLEADVPIYFPQHGRHTFVHEERVVPSTSLPQGYQSVLALLFDVVGQAMSVPGAPTDPSELSGLVLVDGLDIGLHPSVCARLVPHLRRVLPKMQFVVTATSPMTIASLKRDEVVRLDFDDEFGIKHTHEGYDPRLMNLSGLYWHKFGFKDVPPGPLAAKLDDYIALATNPTRDDEAEKRVHKLRAELLAEDVHLAYDIVGRTRTKFLHFSPVMADIMLDKYVRELCHLLNIPKERVGKRTIKRVEELASDLEIYRNKPLKGFLADWYWTRLLEIRPHSKV